MMITTRMMMPEGKNTEQLKAKLSELLKSRQKRCSPVLSSITGSAVTPENRLKKMRHKMVLLLHYFYMLKKKDSTDLSAGSVAFSLTWGLGLGSSSAAGGCGCWRVAGCERGRGLHGG